LKNEHKFGVIVNLSLTTCLISSTAYTTTHSLIWNMMVLKSITWQCHIWSGVRTRENLHIRSKTN